MKPDALLMDTLIDNILTFVSEIQCHAAKIEMGKTVDAHRIYMDACEIEFCIDLLRESLADK